MRARLFRAPLQGGLALAALAVATFASCAAHARDEPEISVHHAYGGTRSFTLEGRVAERETRRAAHLADSWLRNLWRSLRSLRTEERKGFALQIALDGRSWTARSDDEGYFELRAQTPPGVRPGWNTLRIAGADGSVFVDAPLLIVPDGATLGIVSDVDDTVLISEVQDRSHLLAHTFLENYLQRRPVAGMAAFFHGLIARNPRPEAAPVFYLTGSPRQLVPAIRAFLEHNGFPPGPIIAKKLTVGEGGDPLLDQERYKTARLERILEDLPDVKFVLVGDDGERDPEVYRAIRARHPSRVEAVHVRRVSADPGRPTYPGQTPWPGGSPEPDPR